MQMDMKTIGNNIARARKANNMSQAELAERLFISPQAIGKWERGESIPDIVTVGKLADIFAVDLNYFIGKPSVKDETLQANNGIIVEKYPAIAQSDLIGFSGADLAAADFAGVTAHKRRFNGSAMRGANFSAADMTGSIFLGSDLKNAIFNSADLTDCSFRSVDMSNAVFEKTLFADTSFTATDLNGARFTEAKFIGTKFSKTDLRKTILDNCVFDGTEFKHTDLSGLDLSGQSFSNVLFHHTSMSGVSFDNATFRNVSFRSPYALTNRYYRTLKTMSLKGTMMDKLTYAALKGVGIDISEVVVIA